MIHTIKSVDTGWFDKAVNESLADGWEILKLTTAGTERSAVLVAFLHKDEA